MPSNRLNIDKDHHPVVGAVDDQGTGNIYPLEYNIASGGLDVNIVGGSSLFTQYTDGGTPPTHPVGTAIEFNNSGTWATVSAANPLPVSATLSLSNYALETGGNLATTATNTTGLNNTVGTAGSAIPTKGLVIQGSDGTNARAISTDSSGRPNVNINGTVPVSGTFYQSTQPISASSLPLPTGASTSALQTTGNTSLSSIATNTGNIPALGQALAAASVPVVLTAAQLSTLTPPAAITNYALETGGNLATLAGGVSGAKYQIRTLTSADQVTIANASIPVTQSGTWNVGLNAGTNAIGSITNTSFAATQSTAANLNATVVGTGTFAVQAAQSGTWNIGTVTTLTGITNALPAGTNNIGSVNVANNALSSGPLTGQSKIATTGTAVQLNGGTSLALPNGVIITAPSTNSTYILVGNSSVTNTANGTGNGDILAPGASTSFAVSNINSVYINGTAGDWISWGAS